MHFWEQASEQAISEIYKVDYALTDNLQVEVLLGDVRARLEGHIDAYWAPVDGDAADVYEGWREFGGAARALGRKLGFLKKFGLEYSDVHAVVCRKQRDYGHKNISRFGRQGLMVRLHDKVARLENLISASREPNNESIEDNVLDLVGYACIGMMWEKETFLLPCYDSTVAESPKILHVGRAMDDLFAKMGIGSSL